MSKGSIRKLPGSWELRWDEPRGNPRDKDGKRNSRVIAFRGTKSEAEAKLRTILSDLQNTG